VSFSIVELFEPVDVDERKYERLAGATRALDLMLKDDTAQITSVGAGEAIQLSMFQFRAGLAAGTRSVTSPEPIATRRTPTVIRPALTETKARPTPINWQPTAIRPRVTATSPMALTEPPMTAAARLANAQPWRAA
jgi:hypothetical protein